MRGEDNMARAIEDMKGWLGVVVLSLLLTAIYANATVTAKSWPNCCAFGGWAGCDDIVMPDRPCLLNLACDDQIFPKCCIEHPRCE